MSDAALADDTLAKLAEAVCEHPDDDTPRLVWAERLDELTGGDNPRAEFVRVQCELAKLGTPPRDFPVNSGHWSFFKGTASTVFVQNPTDPRVQVGERVDVELCDLPATSKRRRRFGGLLVTDARRSRERGRVVETSVELKMDADSGEWPGDALRRRERELRASKAAEDEWPAVVSAWADKYTFSRGFVSSLTCTVADWLAHADALVQHQPIEAVRLTTLLPMDERFCSDGFAEWRIAGREGSLWMSDEERFFNRDERTIAEILLFSAWPRIRFDTIATAGRAGNTTPAV